MDFSVLWRLADLDQGIKMPIPMDGVPLTKTHREILMVLNAYGKDGTRHIQKMGERTIKDWLDRGWIRIRYDSFDPDRERPIYCITELGSEVAKNDYEFRQFGHKSVPASEIK